MVGSLVRPRRGFVRGETGIGLPSIPARGAPKSEREMRGFRRDTPARCKERRDCRALPSGDAYRPTAGRVCRRKRRMVATV